MKTLAIDFVSLRISKQHWGDGSVDKNLDAQHPQKVGQDGSWPVISALRVEEGGSWASWPLRPTHAQAQFGYRSQMSYASFLFGFWSFVTRGC